MPTVAALLRLMSAMMTLLASVSCSHVAPAAGRHHARGLATRRSATNGKQAARARSCAAGFDGQVNAANDTTPSPAAAAAKPSNKSKTSKPKNSTIAAGPKIPTNAYWAGASSYFIHSFKDADRHAVLDAMKAANLKVVRIFISHIGANAKNTGNNEMPDVEPKAVGTYDDAILKSVDQLMKDCADRGLKLMIALHDRYALGFWDTDTYATQFGVVSQGSSGAQQHADASTFYKSSRAAAAFDQRIKHILSHRNALLGNKPWSQLSNVVHSFEPQNEPLGHMALVSDKWTCDRAGTIRKALGKGSPILVSDGGGITLEASTADWAFNCKNFDIVSVHSYDLSDLANNIGKFVSRAKSAGKQLIAGEWGATGGNKASAIASTANALKKSGVPQMYWEVTKPGAGSADFEVWTNEAAAWAALKKAAA